MLPVFVPALSFQSCLALPGNTTDSSSGYSGISMSMGPGMRTFSRYANGVECKHCGGLRALAHQTANWHRSGHILRMAGAMCRSSRSFFRRWAMGVPSGRPSPLRGRRFPPVCSPMLYSPLFDEAFLPALYRERAGRCQNGFSWRFLRKKHR